MTDHDPHTDPREGDVLYEVDGTLEIHVDWVIKGEVAYRVTDGHGVLQGAYRIPLNDWLAAATPANVRLCK